MTREELLKNYFVNEQKPKVTTPQDIVPFFVRYAKKQKEHFFIAVLNGNHEVTTIKTITIGILNRTLIHPREVFHEAIKNNAQSIILGHNHPSGNLEPSSEDAEITSRLKKAGDIIGIPIIDHIIISKKGFYSYLEDGKL